MNAKIAVLSLTLWVSAWVSGQAATTPKQLHLTLRRQVLVKGPEGNKTWEVVNNEVAWNPRETVLILVDVWNTCPTINSDEVLKWKTHRWSNEFAPLAI